MYKTISFPRNESGTGKIERLRFVIANTGSDEFVNWLDKLSSKEVRHIIGKPYKVLQKKSTESELSLSNSTLNTLHDYYNKMYKYSERTGSKASQLELIGKDESTLGRHGTFSPNHIESIHRWYPYIEGFSSTFVENLISKWAHGAKKIYDPFAGTGTTLTVAGINGIEGYYSEVNPFMRLVIDVKSNVLRRLPEKKQQLNSYLNEIVKKAENSGLTIKGAESLMNDAFPGRPFFVGQRLIDIVSLKISIEDTSARDDDFAKVAKLIIGSIGVPSSEMKRASDLRYRRENELLSDEYDVMEEFRKKRHR